MVAVFGKIASFICVHRINPLHYTLWWPMPVILNGSSRFDELWPNLRLQFRFAQHTCVYLSVLCVIFHCSFFCACLSAYKTHSNYIPVSLLIFFLSAFFYHPFFLFFEMWNSLPLSFSAMLLHLLYSQSCCFLYCGRLTNSPPLVLGCDELFFQMSFICFSAKPWESGIFLFVIFWRYIFFSCLY